MAKTGRNDGSTRRHGRRGDDPAPAGARGDGDTFRHGGWVVRSDRRLTGIVPHRPPGTTGNQWSAAMRTRLDLVVHHADTGEVSFAVVFDDPARDGAEARRLPRLRDAVCEAAGLELFVVEATGLDAATHGRRVVEYLLDARAFTESDPGPAEPDGRPLGYRDIIGRLPDGRSGHVNDLGALARAEAVEAYVGRRLVDPILRGLHVDWKDGPSEGWAWAEARPGGFLFERVRIVPHRFTCGVDPGQLAEDLAVLAVGERLRAPDPAATGLRDRAGLGRALDDLRARRGEMVGGFRFDHVTFGG